MDDLNNLPEQETIENLENLEDEDIHNSLCHTADAENPLCATNPYLNSIFPIIIIDNKMKILSANRACEYLFTGFIDLTGAYYIDVFGKSLGIEEIRNIHNAILGGENGYFWKGEVRLRSRNMVSILTKVYIFPADMTANDPAEFIVMFDDVTEEEKRQTRSTFVSLLEASKLKDNDIGNHIIRVNQYSKKIATELFRCNNPRYNRIDADFIDNIGFLASMHDVGKIGTPDDILNKKGSLSDWEWTLMREHTKNGAFILSSYPNSMAKEIALSHHERWDGSGYPYQLSEEMIPLAARIVAVADVYDALRMERSYKPALTHETAVEKMLEGKESHFDPFLVDVFISIKDSFKQIFQSNIDTFAPTPL